PPPPPRATPEAAVLAAAPPAGAPMPIAPVRHGDDPSAPVTGALELKVRFARDHSPAEGTTIIVWDGGAPRVWGRRATTDASGELRFERLRAGRVHVSSDRADPGVLVTTRDGETTQLLFEVPPGLHLTGIVVDPDGEPVHDALVEVAPLASADRDAEPLATTDEEGRFEVLDAPT